MHKETEVTVDTTPWSDLGEAESDLDDDLDEVEKVESVDWLA